jgi:hypothetical protein
MERTGSPLVGGLLVELMIREAKYSRFDVDGFCHLREAIKAVSEVMSPLRDSNT